MKSVIETSHGPRPDAVNSSSIDGAALAAQLRHVVRGEVRFSDGDRALYSTDGSNYRQVPIGVVIPLDANDVVQALAVCRAAGAPVFGRGGGTSLAGQCCNVGVVFDMSKYMNHLVHLDVEGKRAVVEPGIIRDSLDGPAQKHHLTFAPDPSTHNHCTLGGMIGNNSCGVHSVMGGKTDDNVEDLEIITYDGVRMRVGKTTDGEVQAIIDAGGRRGEIYRKLRDFRDRYADQIRAIFPDIPRRVSGYNLPALLPEKGFDVAKALVGSEGTCVLILQATTRLIDSPPARTLLVLGYPSVYEAADHVMEVMAHKPIALEGLDNFLIEDMKKKGLHPGDVQLLPDGDGWLLVEFGADTKGESDASARELMNALKEKDDAPSMKLFDDESQEKMLWKVRESGLGATARVPGAKDAWEGWEDSSVPPDKLGGYLRDLRKLFEKYKYGCALYGHFGQGCVHTRIDFDLATGPGIEAFRSFISEACDLVLSYGGSLSGEHGDGQSRAEFLPKMFGDEMIQAFREFKAIWDPDGKMNPGKVVDPYLIDQNLRIGAHYSPPAPATFFQYPDDNGSFARATLRCVGVGECRRLDGGTMCPSFMATREEKDSTRGRARLLFEMMEGNPLNDGWRDESVRDALDLCLACKGCKHDCPVNVDMATYKSEFLSHYYEGRLRPRAAYSMGLIYWWARIASRLPRAVNFFAQTPLLSSVAKLAAGVSRHRRMPVFADQTFTSWWRHRPPRDQACPPVILWPDTFNNHFFPRTAQAAVDVLEAAGFRVEVPSKSMCCGRPLYDWGMIGTAQRLLREILDTLRPQLAAGVPVVVLEPSCLAVFRDELVNLFPQDQDAIRLSRQSYLLSEFLQQKAPNTEWPNIPGKALVHGHCHHKSLVGMDDEEAVLRGIGLDYDAPDDGCCGMAGSFGFEAGEHYDVAMKVGERVLLPAVRNADDATYVIADGFSCREQISQSTNREALHLADVLSMALKRDRAGKSSDNSAHPESILDRPSNEVGDAHDRRRLPVTAAIGAGALATGAVAWTVARRASHHGADRSR